MSFWSFTMKFQPNLIKFSTIYYPWIHHYHYTIRSFTFTIPTFDFQFSITFHSQDTILQIFKIPFSYPMRNYKLFPEYHMAILLTNHNLFCPLKFFNHPIQYPTYPPSPPITILWNTMCLYFEICWKMTFV